MLMVKVRPTPAVTPTTFAAFASTAVSAAAAAPGLALVAAFERAGMVKRVTPLAQPAEDLPPPGSALATLAMTAAVTDTPAQPTAASILQGMSLVELERDQDVDHLRLALAQDPNVESVSRVPIRYLVGKSKGTRAAVEEPPTVADVPPPASLMWNLSKIQWAQARSHPSFKEPANIQVAVLDSGVDFAHPDLTGLVKNYTYAHPDLPGAVGYQDIIGHGTHVSGTIGARINNGIGINGICDCYLRLWKIFQDQEYNQPLPLRSGGYWFTFTVDPVMYHRALAECIALKVNVVSLSIGGGVNPNDYPTELNLFNRLIANGTTVVAAMGNDRANGSPTSYPAAYPGVIAVGAVGPDDLVTEFSTAGNHITLCAPGEGIWSTLPTYPGRMGRQAIPQFGQWVPGPSIPRPGGTDYAAWAGTSMATPHATGAVAILLASKGVMSPASVRSLFQRTVDKVPGMFGQPFTPDYGYGRLNLFRMLNES